MQAEIQLINQLASATYPAYGDGYLGKYRIDEVHVNAGWLVLPAAWSKDLSIVTAGSRAEDNIFLAVRNGQDYVKSEIGQMVREAAFPTPAENTEISLFSVAVSGRQIVYGFKASGADPRWRIVRVDVSGAKPRLIGAADVILARPLEVFDLPKERRP